MPPFARMLVSALDAHLCALANLIIMIHRKSCQNAWWLRSGYALRWVRCVKCRPTTTPDNISFRKMRHLFAFNVGALASFRKLAHFHSLHLSAELGSSRKSVFWSAATIDWLRSVEALSWVFSKIGVYLCSSAAILFRKIRHFFALRSLTVASFRKIALPPCDHLTLGKAC